jgi:hypothetical protein
MIAKKIWRILRPKEAVGRPRVTKSDFHFKSVRHLDDGVNASSFVKGWKVDDLSWSVRVRIALEDDQISALRSTVVRRDTHGMYAIDFDVLAAASTIHGEELQPSPLLALEATDSEIEHSLHSYHQKIERIWSFVGGYSASNLKTLAIWAIRNHNAVGSSAVSLGMICAACVYGERKLAEELSADLERRWHRTLLTDPRREAVSAVYANVRSELARLREAMH